MLKYSFKQYPLIYDCWEDQPQIILSGGQDLKGANYVQSQFFFFFFFGPHHSACRIFVPLLGIEPMPPAVEMWSANYWTTREVPQGQFLKKERPSHQWQQELQSVVTVATIGWTGIYSRLKALLSSPRLSNLSLQLTHLGKQVFQRGRPYVIHTHF